MNTLYESPPKLRYVCLHHTNEPLLPGSGVAPPSRRESPRTTPEIPLATQAISRVVVTTPGDLFPQSPLTSEEVSRATLPPPPALLCYQQGAPWHNSPGTLRPLKLINRRGPTQGENTEENTKQNMRKTPHPPEIGRSTPENYINISDNMNQ